MREGLGKSLLRAAGARAAADELHLRYAAANAAFGRLCFPRLLKAVVWASKDGLVRERAANGRDGTAA